MRDFNQWVTYSGSKNYRTQHMVCCKNATRRLRRATVAAAPLQGTCNYLQNRLNCCKMATPLFYVGTYTCSCMYNNLDIEYEDKRFQRPNR
jgi:hypothetical protein